MEILLMEEYSESSRPVYGAYHGPFQSASDLITQRLELGNVRSFSLQKFFSQLFAKHDAHEIEEMFIVGSHSTTPQLAVDMAMFPSPWLFFRVLGSAIAVYLIFLTAS